MFLSFLAAVFILVFNVVALNTYTPVLWEDDLPEEACEDVVGCVLALWTGGAIGESMDTFDLMRFFFDTVYSTFMDTMFGSIVSGLMIDAFSELKEQDQARQDDKNNICYICGTPKPDVLLFLFRLKKAEATSRFILKRSTLCGTTCTTFMYLNKKTPLITLVLNLKLTDKWVLMK